MAQVAKIIHLQQRRGVKAPRPSRLVEARSEKLARIIHAAIDAELGQVDFFTREDLLQLRVLQSVATITRYQMVCQAVHWLVGSRRLVSLTRTELCRPGGANITRKLTGANLIENHAPTVRRLITRWSATNKGPFDTTDLLTIWTSDPHLTLNAKRVVIRSTLKSLRRDLTLRDGPRFMSFLAQGD